MTQATHRVAPHVGMMGAKNLRARGVDAFFSGGGGRRGRVGEEGGKFGGREKERREKGGRGACGSSLEILHAMVAGDSHDDAPVAVDGNAAKRKVELSVA